MCLSLSTSVCTCCSVAVSFRLSFSDVALLWQVSQRFLSLHHSLSVSLLVSVSLFLWCHSILSWLSWLCADLPLPLRVSVRSCLSLSLRLAWCSEDVTEVVWTSVSLYQLSISRLLLFFLLYQNGVGCEKAVHLGIAGDELHVPVNTRPLAILSHLVSSSPLLCSSLLMFLKY